MPETDFEKRVLDKLDSLQAQISAHREETARDIGTLKAWASGAGAFTGFISSLFFAVFGALLKGK